ncbi:Hemicentin-1 [Stylophora pistillata]|uniref:Hemicentin-1 n=1 Tax=Stylophora pistillata TaxID=50429 RepID=A0A2B4SMV0_STYPI|nr:Hemicentin-1 [Stylophora pistillata]
MQVACLCMPRMQVAASDEKPADAMNSYLKELKKAHHSQVEGKQKQRNSAPIRTSSVHGRIGNGKIPDAAIAASSIYNPSYKSSNGQLYNYPAGWVARTTDLQQWFQVDFGDLTLVKRICTQGDAICTQVNGGYSAWAAYGDCSKTCGGGERTRERICTNPPPGFGGNDCTELGLSSFTRSCNKMPCPGEIKAVDCYVNSAPAILPQAFDKNVESVSGTEAIVKYCQERATKFGYKIFCVDNKGCWSGDNAASVYDDYGRSKGCTMSKKTRNGVGSEINADIFVYQPQE